MPLYEYQCEACGARFELIRKFSDPPLEACSKCGKGPVTKLVSSPAFQFKGSGWYITDYARKDGGGDSKTSSSTTTTDSSTTASKDTPAEKPAAASTTTSTTKDK